MANLISKKEFFSKVSRSKIFSVTFEKKDGTIKKITAMLPDMDKLVKGVGHSMPSGYVLVWDMSELRKSDTDKRRTKASFHVDKILELKQGVLEYRKNN